MANARFVPVLQHLRRLATAPASVDSDAVLLGRLTSQRDRDAFAALVHRHGPLVWRVCHRVLTNPEACEDAFQATFLVLARKACSIRKPAALPGWLHRTAFRIACASKASIRKQPDGRVPDIPATTTGPAHDAAAREIGRILEEEVAALPERLRLAVLLCYWDGRTNEEAAQQLGWASGTLKARLTRARELLRRRMVQRGVTLPVGALALLLSPSGSSEAAPPFATVNATIQSAMHVARGAVASLSAERVLTLADGVTQAMLMSKLKICVALVLGLAVLGLGLASLAAAPWWFSPEGDADPPKTKVVEAPQQAAVGEHQDVKKKPVDPKTLTQPNSAQPDRIEPGDRLRIRVANGLPEGTIDGIFLVEASGKVALGLGYGRVEISGRTLEAAEKVIVERLSSVVKAPAVSVTRYDPIADASSTQGAVAKQLQQLEQRMEQVENELRALRRVMEKRDKKLGD